jgi:integrase
VDLMLGTGMRIGEVMALQWGAVNLSPDGLPTVAVEATMVDIKRQGTVRQEMPKTDAGERTIIIPPFVVASLTAIRPEATTAGMPVFASRRFKDGRNVGRPVTTHNMRRMLRAALDLAEMTGEVHRTCCA